MSVTRRGRAIALHRFRGRVVLDILGDAHAGVRLDAAACYRLSALLTDAGDDLTARTFTESTFDSCHVEESPDA